MVRKVIRKGEIFSLKPGHYIIFSSRPAWISGDRDIVTKANESCLVRSLTPLLIGGADRNSLEICYDPRPSAGRAVC